MKRSIVLLACSVAILALTAGHSIGEEHHIKADFQAENNSGVSGFVNLVQLPKGGANVNVVASGLKPDETYTVFYYESGNCTEPADPLETVQSDEDGSLHANGKIDDDLDEVGSVSIRLGPGYGELQACAHLH